MIYYFGTDLTSAGHFMWQLEGNAMMPCRGYEWGTFEAIPFNPEKYPHKPKKLGEHQFIRIECNGKFYTMVAICGSCTDDRPGSKSVFWVDENITYGELLVKLTNTPAVMAIIKKMPFKVALFNIPNLITQTS